MVIDNHIRRRLTIRETSEHLMHLVLIFGVAVICKHLGIWLHLPRGEIENQILGFRGKGVGVIFADCDSAVTICWARGSLINYKMAFGDHLLQDRS